MNELPEYFVCKFQGCDALAVPCKLPGTTVSHTLLIHRRWIEAAGTPKIFRSANNRGNPLFMTVVFNDIDALLAGVTDRYAVTVNLGRRPRLFDMDDFLTLFPILADDGRVFHPSGKITVVDDWHTAMEWKQF